MQMENSNDPAIGALEDKESRILKAQNDISGPKSNKENNKSQSWNDHPLMKRRGSRTTGHVKDAEVQTEEESDEVTLEDLMSDEPSSRAYWKQLANIRLKSLEEALEKNYEMSTEISLMQQFIDDCEETMKLVHDSLEESGQDPDPEIEALLRSIEQLRTDKKSSKSQQDSSALSEGYFSEANTSTASLS